MNLTLKKVLLEIGKEKMSQGGKGLSTIDKPLHNTQKQLAEKKMNLTL